MARIKLIFKYSQRSTYISISNSEDAESVYYRMRHAKITGEKTWFYNEYTVDLTEVVFIQLIKD